MSHRSSVVIYSSIPWEWSADYFRQTAIRLADFSDVSCFVWHHPLSFKEHYIQGKKITFFKKVDKILIYTGIYFIPFRRFRKIERINLVLNVWLFWVVYLLRSFYKGYAKRFLWMFDPSLYPFLPFTPKTFKIVFDYVDFFAGHLPKEKRVIAEKNEKKLFQASDWVFANSMVLKERLGKYGGEVVLVPQGFSEEDFSKKSKTLRAKSPKPILGYVGGINNRLNYALLRYLATNNPDWEFVFWGPVQTDSSDAMLKKKIKELSAIPNVLFGSSGRDKLFDVISSFDVCIIPYAKNDFNRFCYPMKLFEYFYMGKPVVSSEILELKQFPKYVKLANSNRSWEEAIKDFLARPWPDKYKSDQKKIARENSWERKLSKMMSTIGL